MSRFMRQVVSDVEDRRREQNARWGDVDKTDRHMPFGCANTGARRVLRDAAIAQTQRAMEQGTCTWANILREEFMEALAEDETLGNWPQLRHEIIDIAAVAVAMAEAGDLRAEEAQKDQAGNREGEKTSV